MTGGDATEAGLRPRNATKEDLRRHPEIVLESCDGATFVVNCDILDFSPTLYNLVRGVRMSFTNTLGGSTFSVEGHHVIVKQESRVLATLARCDEEQVLMVLPEIRGRALEVVIKFCQHLLDTDADSEDESTAFDFANSFLPKDMSYGFLCEVASASYYLDIRQLVNITSRLIAAGMSMKAGLGDLFQQTQTAEGMKSALPPCPVHDSNQDGSLPSSEPASEHDFPKESNNTQMNNGYRAPSPRFHEQDVRSRLARKLLKRRQGQHTTQVVSGTASSVDNSSVSHPTSNGSLEKGDNRSLEELLQFIEDDHDNAKTGKKKKRRKKRKPRQQARPGSPAENEHRTLDHPRTEDDADDVNPSQHHDSTYNAQSALDDGQQVFDDAPDAMMGDSLHGDLEGSADDYTFTSLEAHETSENADDRTSAAIHRQRLAESSELSEFAQKLWLQSFEERRAQALAKLQALEADNVEWASSSEDNEEEDLDLEVETFRRRLEGTTLAN